MAITMKRSQTPEERNYINDKRLNKEISINGDYNEEKTTPEERNYIND